MSGGIGTGLPINPFGAIPMITLANSKSMEGIAFSVRKRITMAAAAVEEVIFDPTAFTGTNLVFLPLGFDSLGGPIRIDIIGGATADSDGVLWTPYNRDFSSANVAESLLRLNPNNIVAGAGDPIELFLPSDGTGAAGSSSASTQDALVANIDFTKKYLIRFTNTDASGTAEVGFKVNFFEVA